MPDTPVTTDPEAIELLRQALDRSDYSSARLQETLELEGPFSLDWSALPVYRRQLGQGSPFASVTKLFLLGEEVSRDDAERAFAPLTVDRLVEVGVLAADGDAVLAPLSILPWSGFLIASDPIEKELPPTRPDHVLNLIPPSITLASITSRRPVGATLDVGVGCGVQSLLAASHSERVVGVDVNPRALRFAEFNLALNRVSNVELRLGDVFEAVEGETFDLIVSNPPYVISPEAHYTFRDSGRPADSFCEDLAHGAPAFLREGGKAVLLLSWVHRPDEDWAAPLRRWVEGTGSDAIAIHLLSQEPLGYVSLMNRPLRWDPVAYDRAIDRWLEYFRSHAIETISWGALVLRRRQPPNWFAPQEASMATIGEAGEHLERMIEAHDHLAAIEEADGLLATRFRLADDHRLDQTVVLRGGGGTIQRAVLRLEGGFNFRLELSRDGFQLVSLLDGRQLDEALDEAAGRIEGATREELLPQAVGTVKELYELGFVVRVNENGDRG